MTRRQSCDRAGWGGSSPSGVKQQMLAISRALMSRRPRLRVLDDPRYPGGPNCWRATNGFASLILEGDPGCGTDFFAHGVDPGIDREGRYRRATGLDCKIGTTATLEA